LVIDTNLLQNKKELKYETRSKRLIKNGISCVSSSCII
jgi:hypothetical protein